MCRRILCYGDSNTYGYDPRSYLGGRYPESVRWTSLLNTADWEVINGGENGRAIPRLSGEIEAAKYTIRHANANALVIMLGSNDLLQQPCPSAEVCAKRMENFLSILLSEIPAALKVLLIAPTIEAGTWISGPEILAESRRLAECYKATAHRLGISFADAGAWGIESAYDGVHFSAEGHQIFAKKARTVLEGLFQEAL